MRTPAVAIEVVDLCCSLGGHPVLQQVSFSVDQGEYLSIVGPNGAGKSTLLKCLDGILDSWEGSIRLDGRDLRQCRQRDIARCAAYVPQARGGVPGFSVTEFLLLSRYARQGPLAAPGKHDYDAVQRALELTDTAALRHRRMATLSGGECQKVYIAAALAQASPILLLDEPITFLDPRYQHEVNTLLKHLNREEGFTVITVSHDINSAVLSSHRILGLKQGRCVFWGEVRELMKPDPLKRIFGTDFLFVDHPESGLPIVVPRH